ncbi:hypothetical protein E4T48_02180 [Aureobasidium sp. EXF-10727]|nr:hypothetical protein E4T48_02180 [Aureobasidium sp. EXF-10727]
MQQDSIQKASSVEVAEGRKGSLLRPIVIRGDSFFNERNANATLDDNTRLASGSLRPRFNSISSARTPTSPVPKSPSYRPDWAQDAEDMRVQPLPVDEDELGSPEDLRDMLRMGRTQEMRVGLDLVRHVVSFAGSMCVTASLAEMSSMSPSSAGQYFWVSEFASKRCQQFLSYITGCIVCGSACPANADPTEVIMGVLSPHIPARRAFLRIENTEWSSAALAALSGQTNANYACFYEERLVRRWTRPHPVFAICVPSIKAALNHPTGYSLLYVLQLSVPNGVIVALAQAAQGMSYILAISSVLYRRIKSPEKLPRARWSLGPIWGPINNVLGILFSINCFIWSFTPPSLPITSTNFNVAVALFVGLLVLMTVTYYFRRKEYVGPVARKRDTPSWNMSQLGTDRNVQFLTIPEEL